MTKLLYWNVPRPLIIDVKLVFSNINLTDFGTPKS